MATAPEMTNRGSRRYPVPAVCVAVAGIGTIVVIDLADAVTESDGLATLDPQITASVVANRTPVLTALAQGLTFVGDGSVRVVLALIATLLLWRWTHGLRAPALLLFAIAGSSILTYGLKVLIGRERPGITSVIGPVANSLAFPSGHTLNSTVFFGTLAGLVWAGLRSHGARAAVVIAGLLLSTGIGLSRIYLGYHWATDVLGGWAAAVTWLALVALVAYFSRKHPSGRSA